MEGEREIELDIDDDGLTELEGDGELLGELLAELEADDEAELDTELLAEPAATYSSAPISQVPERVCPSMSVVKFNGTDSPDVS